MRVVILQMKVYWPFVTAFLSRVKGATAGVYKLGIRASVGYSKLEIGVSKPQRSARVCEEVVRRRICRIVEAAIGGVKPARPSMSRECELA